MNRDKIIVGVSGGVDSAYSLLKLQKEGFHVIGVTLLTQKALESAKENLELARKSCEDLGIKHIAVDVTSDFNKYVINYFSKEYREGRTPNPCVNCNLNVKIAKLIEVADKENAALVSTGHYAGTVTEDGFTRICRGKDKNKDQSYFLCKLPSEMIKRLYFPLSTSNKSDVKARAKDNNLRSATVAESEDICFISDGDYRSYLKNLSDVGFEPGDILDEDGNKIGRHTGIINYTIGQRKGIGAHGGPWFVKKIDSKSNSIVAKRGTSPITKEFDINNCTFNIEPADLVGHEFGVQTNYRSVAHAANVVSDGKSAHITFLDGGTLVSPGQTAAIYVGDTVIGGGDIA